MVLALLAAVFVPLSGMPPPPETLEQRFAPPPGFARVAVAPDSFGAFLRAHPLHDAGAPVLSHDGRVLSTTAPAVFDLSVGPRDLQQCADSAMRLWAEHLWRSGRGDALSFHTTSGAAVPWSRYHRGERIVVDGSRVRFAQKADAADTPAVRQRYLDDVFLYAGSRSLALDTVAVTGRPAPGDLYVLPGSPGHVLVVLDVVTQSADPTAWRVLLGQGFMPAQSFHVVRGPGGVAASAWIAPDARGAVTVASWPAPFPSSSLRRFQDPGR